MQWKSLHNSTAQRGIFQAVEYCRSLALELLEVRIKRYVSYVFPEISNLEEIFPARARN